MPAAPTPSSTPPILGIHHITAIAGDAQANLDFYVGVLGLRLVKQTVNFDDPGTFHFYFADTPASPGAVLTFFPWKHIRPGRSGTGSAAATAFAVAPGSIDWWSERLRRLGVAHEPAEARFGDERVLRFADQDGTQLELVGASEHEAIPADEGGTLPSEHAIRGFHSATLALSGYESTARLLTRTMGFREGASAQNRFRFIAAGSSGTAGRYIDLLCTPDAPGARMGAGSVHHVAFRTPSDEAQHAWREALAEAGLNATPIMDRQYFHSIYFREPGGVIFEFATDGPGFTTDETVETLGSGLRLPPWLEPRREAIERGLPRVTPPSVQG